MRVGVALLLGLGWASVSAAAPTLVGLPAAPRAVPSRASASRDAPALEYAYGPRAQMSLGHAVGLLARRGDVGWHLWTSALMGLENADAAQPLPVELGRLRIELGFAVDLTEVAHRHLGARGALELGISLGVERVRELRAAETDRFAPTPRSGDIAFGGGGAWLGLDARARWTLAPDLHLTLGLAERVFAHTFAEVFAGPEAADHVVSAVAEGLAHAPAAEASLRWVASPSAHPLVAVFGEALLPADDSADASGFARALLGVALPGEAAEALPFLSVDVGSGKGLLINRHEVRLSLGVRYAPR